MSQNPNPKPGLLCEDADAIEVQHADGTQHIQKTPDRGRDEQILRESDGIKPVHPPIVD